MRNPHNPFTARTAENQFCAWALQHPEWLNESEALPAPHHFEEPRLAALFTEILSMRSRGLIAKPDTLETWVATREDWTLAELFETMTEGRTGSIVEFDACALAITKAANGRALMGKLDDARMFVLENATDDPGVLLSSVEAVFRIADLGGAADSISVGDMADAFIDDLEAGRIIGFKTGIDAIDERHGSFMRGEFVVVAGETGSGKTTLATNIARAFAKQGLRGHFASYEMGKAPVSMRMLSAVSYLHHDRIGRRFPYKDLKRDDRGGVTTELLRTCARVLREVYPTLRVLPSAAQTLEELEASVRGTRRALGGLDFVIVDYLQLMRSSNSKADRHLQIAEITRGLKAMAERLGVLVVGLAQLSRENRKRSNKRPQRSDMRESASIEHDADVILAVYREARELEIDLEQLLAKPAFTEQEKQDLDVEINRLEARIERARNDMEVISLKVRMGEEGVDHVHALLAYDVIQNVEQPRRHAA